MRSFFLNGDLFYYNRCWGRSIPPPPQPPWRWKRITMVKILWPPQKSGRCEYARCQNEIRFRIPREVAELHHTGDAHYCEKHGNEISKTLRSNWPHAGQALPAPYFFKKGLTNARWKKEAKVFYQRGQTALVRILACASFRTSHGVLKPQNMT